MNRYLVLGLSTTLTVMVTSTHGAIDVLSGMEIDVMVSPLPGGVVPRLEAVRNREYGDGVLAAVVDRGAVRIYQLSDSGDRNFAAWAVPDGAEIQTIRFDTSRIFNLYLLVGVSHNNRAGGANFQTDIYIVKPDGSPGLSASLGSATDPFVARFDVTSGAGGYAPGIYLLDTHAGGGIGLYHLDGGFRARLLGRDVLPAGRRTLTPWGVEFDRTGAWDYMLTIADSDVGDDATVIYHMDPSLSMRPLGSAVRLSQRMYRDMAYSTTGFFRKDIYLTDVRNKSVLRVKSDGSASTIASGFNMVESLTMSEDGDEMFVSDLDGVYRIRREPPPPPPPPPTARMQYVSLSVGVGVDGLTSSLVNVGQPVISAASNGVTFLQAGIMPSLAGGILPPVPGDFDGNRRVDLNDYSGFEDCLAGPDSGVGEQCDIGDFDGDGDLDLEDVDAFMRRFTGPGS